MKRIGEERSLVIVIIEDEVEWFEFYLRADITIQSSNYSHKIGGYD